MKESAAGAEARLGSTRLSGWPQRLLHLAALAFGWGLFFWSWYDVFGQHWDTTALKWLVAGALVVMPAMTVAWVLHNVGIYRRKGPRNGVRPVVESYPEDWNGRAVVADFPAMRDASIVVIDVKDERKVYRAAAAPQLRRKTAASAQPQSSAGTGLDDDQAAAGVAAT